VSLGRIKEGRLCLEGGLEAARASGLLRPELTARNLATDLYMIYDLPGAEEHALAGMELARRYGARASVISQAGNLCYVLIMEGRWDEAVALVAELGEPGDEASSSQDMLRMRLGHIAALRGDVATARGHQAPGRAWASSDDIQARSYYLAMEAVISRAAGDDRAALVAADGAIQVALDGGIQLAHENLRTALPEGIDAALALDNLDAAERMLAIVTARQPGEIPPFLRAHVARGQALVDARRGRGGTVERGLLEAEQIFLVIGCPYWLARTQLDRGEWLLSAGRMSDAAADGTAAAVTFEALAIPVLAMRARSLGEREAVGHYRVVPLPAEA
jgi:hypothetical protein